MLRQIRKKTTVHLVRLIFKVTPLIPYKAAQKAGAVLGFLAYGVLAKYRKRALRNLKERLRIPDAQARSLAKKIFRNQGMNFMEFFHLRRIRKEYFGEYYEIVNLEILKNACLKGKGVILLTAHFGNWESIVPVICQSGFALNVIARRFYIRELDEILTKVRSSMGLKVISRDQSDTAKSILKALRTGEIIGMLVDQNIKSVPSVDVDFFGEKAPTPIGPAAIALRQGCSIVPCFSRRNERGVHVIECFPEVEIEQTGDRRNDVRSNTQKITGIIEAVVRDHPDQWVWFHRRWREECRA